MKVTSGEIVPTYSPDGKKIALVDFSKPAETLEIYTINVDGGSRIKVTDNKTSDLAPTWEVGSGSSLRPLERGDVEKIGSLCERVCLTGSVPYSVRHKY